VLFVVHAYREDFHGEEVIRIISARRAEKLRSEDIGSRQFTEKERQVLRRAARLQASGRDSDINFRDMPRLTDEQLAHLVKLREVRRKVAVSVRLDPQVLDWLKSKGGGHLTRINDILMNVMDAERGRGSRQ
jgi:uncharacterized protein (DUF4415 family)